MPRPSTSTVTHVTHVRRTPRRTAIHQVGTRAGPTPPGLAADNTSASGTKVARAAQGWRDVAARRIGRSPNFLSIRPLRRVRQEWLSPRRPLVRQPWRRRGSLRRARRRHRRRWYCGRDGRHDRGIDDPGAVRLRRRAVAVHDVERSQDPSSRCRPIKNGDVDITVSDCSSSSPSGARQYFVGMIWRQRRLRHGSARGARLNAPRCGPRR